MPFRYGYMYNRSQKSIGQNINLMIYAYFQFQSMPLCYGLLFNVLKWVLDDIFM